MTAGAVLLEVSISITSPIMVSNVFGDPLSQLTKLRLASVFKNFEPFFENFPDSIFIFRSICNIQEKLFIQ